MKKRLNIDGKVVEMSFEEAYKQFAPFRNMMVSKWSNLPLDKDDLRQEVDMYFYKAYKLYDEKYIAFIKFLSFAYTKLDKDLLHLFKYLNAQVRKANYSPISYDMMLDQTDNSVDIKDLILQEDGFEENVCYSLVIEKALDKLRNDTERDVVKMLMNGRSQVETAKIVKCYQPRVSKISTKFAKLLKEELAS